MITSRPNSISCDVSRVSSASAICRSYPEAPHGVGNRNYGDCMTIRGNTWRILPPLVAALLAAGCSSSEGTTTTDAAGTTASAPRPSPKSPDQLYLDTVRKGANVANVSDDALLVAGRSACDALDRGAEPIEVLSNAMETAGDDGMTILATAVTMLCREHLPAMEELADS